MKRNETIKTSRNKTEKLSFRRSLMKKWRRSRRRKDMLQWNESILMILKKDKG